MFENINVMYINLASRIDRNTHVQTELKKIGVDHPERFNAIKLEDGALGCSMSHLKCIELAKKNNYEYVFVCEDDIEFLNPELFLTQLKNFLTSNIASSISKSGCKFSFLTGFVTDLPRIVYISLQIHSPNKFVQLLLGFKSGRIFFNNFFPHSSSRSFLSSLFLV